MLFSSGSAKSSTSSSIGTWRVAPSASIAIGPAIETGGALSSNVDLDPDRLILVGADGNGRPPRPGAAFSGTSCTGFQPVGSAGAAGESRSYTHEACDGVSTRM